MDVYEKLTRALLRRKYEKVDGSRSGDEVAVKRRSVEVPKADSSKGKSKHEPLPIVNPKRFTILSSGNDVVDEAWLRDALRRTLDEGRIVVLTKGTR